MRKPSKLLTRNSAVTGNHKVQTVKAFPLTAIDEIQVTVEGDAVYRSSSGTSFFLSIGSVLQDDGNFPSFPRIWHWDKL